jgi:hypothetical protein
MMLRDGKHIKEPPPQIGKYWTRVERPVQREKSSEEHLMEAILLGYDPSDLSPWKQLLARILRI